MKKKEAFVIFQINKDGQCQEAKVYTEHLRKMLNEAKLSKTTTEVELTLEYDGQSINLPIKVADIRKLIKQSELCIKMVPHHLSQYLIDLTNHLTNYPKAPIVGRNDEIEKVWFYLSQKTKNNVFLVGHTDVGKTTIAYEIARQISTNECPKEFYEKRVLMLKPELLLRIENEHVYKRTVKALLIFLVKHKKDIVLYIDKAIYMLTNEHLLIMFYSFITQYHIPIITTSDTKQFENYFAQNSGISKYVNEVYVATPEMDEIAPMIKNHIFTLQKKYGIKISEEMLKFGIFTSVLSNSVSKNPGRVINVFDKAFLEAKRKEKDAVDKQCILSCYNSYWKLYKNTSDEEKKMIAYHETGHYVVSIMCQHVKDEKIAFVSILPMMDFLGVNWPYKILGKSLKYTKEYFLDQIAIYLGGRVAEKLITSEDSTTASSDLTQASSIAEVMLTCYGLSQNVENMHRSYVTSNYEIKDYLISEKRKEEFDKEIQGLVDEGYRRAEKIINENKELIEVIANKLLEEEILTGEQLTQICNNYRNK